MDSKDSANSGSLENSSSRNPYVIASFTLGFLTGLNAILAGSDYYFAGFPAHGPVAILGMLWMIFGLVIILGSFLILSRKARIAGAVLVLVFGLIPNALFTFDFYTYTHITILLMPLVSFILAVWAVKWDRK